MAITVQDTADTDLPRACEIERVAYTGNSLSPILYPGPFPADSTHRRVNQLIKMRQDDPSVKYIQAVDKETGTIIAFAKWNIYDTTELASTASRSLEFGSGANQEACKAFFGGLRDKKKELMGDTPHLYLHMLHTDPKFQGRGAGSLLIQWGTQKADKLRLPVYLESSKKGYSLYQKHGFKDQGVLRFDLAQFGGSGYFDEPLMLRKPQQEE